MKRLWPLVFCAGCSSEGLVARATEVGIDASDTATAVADVVELVESSTDDTHEGDASTVSDVDACVPNACGGCAALVGAPGDGCGGKCGTARLACIGGDDLECVDPVMTPGTDVSCSTCGTIKYVCAPDGSSTTCEAREDTGPGIDFSFAAKDPVALPRLERTREYLLFFKARNNKLTPFKITLLMRRVPYVCPRTDSCTSLDARCSCGSVGGSCACTVTDATDDPIGVTYLKGSSIETPSRYLGGALLTSDKIGDAPTPVTITLGGSGDPALVNAGDDAFIQIFSDSSRYAYELYGAASASEAPPEYRVLTRNRWPYSADSIVAQPGRPNLTTTMWGCFP